MRNSFLSITPLIYAAVVRGALGPTTNLFIENGNVSPDGFSRSAILIGGTQSTASFPGPLLTATKGDTFNINVVNMLNDTTMLMGTSIHWHGFIQKGTAWADGAAGVTQCPIAPGHSFNYQFSTANNAGTYWYHSHYSTQYCDGLRGAMVVYDPNDPYLSQYDFDNESTVITLADWYHIVAPTLSEDLGPTSAASTLINGLGRSTSGVASPLAVISVVPNKRYRMRLVSLSCDPNYTFSIDAHNMTIIEVEGTNVTPVIVDSIQIYAGQRYSFILKANMPVSNYWIRAMPNIGATGGTFAGGVNSAILRYVGAPTADPTSLQSPSVIPLFEPDLHPLNNPAAPGPPVPAASSNGAVMELPLVIGFDEGIFSVNNVVFSPPTIPVLLQILSGAQTAESLLPSGSVYLLPPNKVIEITMNGGTVGAPHPIHLHGHTFSVIRSAGSTVYNYANPVRRDVVNTGIDTNDLVTIRFVTDNSGPWIMHCHIDWHLEHGLSVVMAENVTGIPQLARPAAWDQLCPIFNALPAQTFD